jgi:adenylate cyclase
MGQKQKQRVIYKIPFSIGVKLITIISLIVIISLGSITALVSWLVHDDLRLTAEENNYEVNRRSAIEAESTIANVRSNSRILMQTITAAGTGSTIARQTTEFFFAENPQIAAVYFVVPGNGERLFVNRNFFFSREMDEVLADSYFKNQRAAFGRAVRGETVLLNAARHFERSVLAMFFPWQNSGVGAVLFSSENMNNNFGFGTNQSCMINSSGDILVHANFALVREAVNLSGEEFIRSIFDSSKQQEQHLLESSFNILQNETSEVKSGFFAVTWETLKRNAMPVFEKTSNAVTGAAAGFGRLFNIEVKKPQLNPEKQNVPEGNKGKDVKIRQYAAYTKLNTAGAVVITCIEYDKVFEELAATTRRNIYLTVAVLSISIIFIWFFSKTISVPLKALAAAAQKIESGIFEIELKSKGRDEIGILTASFQQMCKALNVFGKFTNRGIAVKAMRGEIKPGGFPKHATIFFSDIREFTAKSEQFTRFFGSEASERIVCWLNNYFTRMVECVEKTNGVVDKFIGDAVMAHWGTAYSEGSPRKDAFNCIKAALMMRKALYLLNKKCKVGDLSNPIIRIGCGINTGIVTAGQIGSDLRMEYTVIGDPVNLASRVEALTKPLGADILITEDTWRLAGDKFITEEMPSVTVKGKEKPVRIFAVVNFAENDKGPRTLADVRRFLGIKTPDISKVDVDADEKKYKIGT